MNPCPCGWLGAQWPGRSCRCTPDQVGRYQARLSGPLLDRIDLQVEVAALPPAELLAKPLGEASAVVAQRVAAARDRQLARQGLPNAQLPAAQLDTHCRLDEPTRRFAEQTALRLGWSARGLHRALKVARTIADLDGAQALAMPHLAEAVQYRRALPGGST